jgi:hypothetical protein
MEANMNLTEKKTLNTTIALGLFACGLAFAPAAHAGCGDVTWSPGPLDAEWAASISLPAASRLAVSAQPNADQPGGADIVGMWAFKFTAQNSPGIPDGAPIDFGFAQWHSDGTEITNSGSRDPRTGNFCLGVWKKTGPSTYKLNHKGLSWDTVGNFIGPATISEDVTVDSSGETFSGHFTIVQYDTHGNVIAKVAGVVTAERVTVD